MDKKQEKWDIFWYDLLRPIISDEIEISLCSFVEALERLKKSNDLL